MRNTDTSKKIYNLFDKYPRDFYVAIFFGIIFITILFKVFSYTVLNGDYYKQLASLQHMSETKIEVKRGSIFSNNKGGSILATGVDLNDIAIDPQVEGNKNKLEKFLTNIIFKQLCYLKTKNECKNNLTKFIKVLKINDFSYSDSYIKNKINEQIKKQLSRNKVTSVLLRDNLTKDESYELTRLNLTGIYVNNAYLYANPEEIFDTGFVVEKLSTIIDIDKIKTKKYIRKRDLRYIPIYNRLSIGVSDDIKEMIDNELTAFSKGIISKSDMISGFIILNPNATRFYPENNLGAQVIGFVDSDMEGHYGLEGYFNNLLRGKEGTTLTMKDTMGRTIDPFTLENDLYAVGGVNIISTIDRNIQNKVEEILKNGVEYYNANKGSIIVMNPKTGEILSMANYPSYNPNKPGDVYELEKVKLSDYSDPVSQLLGIPILTVDTKKGSDFFYNGKILKLRELSREEIGDFTHLRQIYKYKNNFGAGVYRNNIIQDLYEPGSILKPLTVAIGLNINEIGRYDLYEDKGFVKIDNFKIKNVNEKCLGLNSFQHALNYSCNVGMIRIAQKIGKSIFSKYLDNFGFGKLVGLTLDGEVYGKIEPYEKWSRAKLFTTSFGQGITSTVLQMASSYSVLANGGIYVQPQIVKELRFDDGKVVENKIDARYRVIRKDVSDTITRMLVDGIENGVAKNGAVEGYKLAGKTGTSQIAYKGKYEIGSATTVGSYAGYGPAENPKFVIVVKLDRPRRNQFGGQTSAYLFSDVSKFLLDYYGIAKENE